MIRIIDLNDTPPPDPIASRESTGNRDGDSPLNPCGIAFITPVKDQEQYRTCLRYIDALEIPSGYAVEKIAVYGGASMAEVYQRAMEASTARYKIYLHVDCYVVHKGLLPELLNLFRTYPRLGMIGVAGATRLPARVLLSANNSFHCYGRHWAYRRPGGPSALLGSANRRRLDSSRFRSFVGDYLPAAAVDGFFMATQYDVPWVHPQFGFDLYDQVQALEFVQRGLEIGIARQETTWCVHWGPLKEPSREQHRSRQIGLRHKVGIFRELYPTFIGVPAQKLYERYRGEGDLEPTDRQRERLGVILSASNGQDMLLRALGTLLRQCEALKEVEYQVVVVDHATIDSTTFDGTAEATRREFPQVTMIANAFDGGPARALNVGLQRLGFPGYVLVMNDDIEFPHGVLARMVSHLREHRSIAGVSPMLINPDGTAQTQRRAIVELVSRWPNRLQPVTFLGTTCALARGEVFFDVGLYDERFFSDAGLEWSLRARRKGYQFAFLPEARVVHYRSRGSRQDGREVFGGRPVDNLLFLYKHGGIRWATALYRAQRILAGVLAIRWRNDSEALRHLREAMARAEDLHRRFCQENRLPELL